MHEHGPDCLDGPIRGSYAWWRGMTPQYVWPQQNTRKNVSPCDNKGIRKDLVERVRREIAAGIYDTPEKWDAALDALVEQLE